ncbi:MAG: hypothetical protein HY515_04930 [Candidatus Aenigmarchaeota archaeon]|nr:hypothetical protein [Candidatus Aenigmarchaeota archaeon]
MTILDVDKVDIISESKDGKYVDLSMVWHDTWNSEATNALFRKIGAYEEYVYNPEFLQKDKGKLISITLFCKYTPTERIKTQLKLRGGARCFTRRFRC